MPEWLLPTLGTSYPLVSGFFLFVYMCTHTHTHQKKKHTQKTSYTQWGKLIDIVKKHRGMLIGKHFMTCAFYQLYKIVP